MQTISVIIPIYNIEKYLRECLDSVVNQTFKDIEIICVDDCGTDNSMTIVEEYAQKDERIKIIHHEYNKGAAVSRNDGMEVAVGEYILYLDSDDYIAKDDILEKVYNKIINTNADIVVTSTEFFTDEERNIINYDSNVFNFEDIDDCITNQENFLMIYGSVTSVAWGKLYKKEFLTRNNITFVNKNVWQEDDGYWIKILTCSPKLSLMSDIGTCYRINRKDSIKYKLKRNKIKHSIYQKIVFEDILEYIKNTKNKEDSKYYIKALKKSNILGQKSLLSTILETIFSVKNENGKKHKVITILGIKIKIKRKK